MASKHEASDIADNGEDDFPEALLGDFDTSRLEEQGDEDASAA
jgi:hypothetical protein